MSRAACTIDFQNMNYTVITSKCKGPKYPANLCCGALKEFACPHTEELNDITNDCASTMFSYINLYGKYPPGIFANECRGDQNGLSCPDDARSNKLSEKKSSGQKVSNHSSMLMLVSGFLVFLYHFFWSVRPAIWKFSIPWHFSLSKISLRSGFMVMFLLRCTIRVNIL